MVHHLDGRDLHLRDGSRIQYRWQLVVSDYRCVDCGIDTDAIGEYHMLDLIAAITTWAEHWNTNPTPFIWKATAEDIITKVRRGRQTLHQFNSETVL